MVRYLWTCLSHFPIFWRVRDKGGSTPSSWPPEFITSEDIYWQKCSVFAVCQAHTTHCAWVVVLRMDSMSEVFTPACWFDRQHIFAHTLTRTRHCVCVCVPHAYTCTSTQSAPPHTASCAAPSTRSSTTTSSTALSLQSLSWLGDWPLSQVSLRG